MTCLTEEIMKKGYQLGFQIEGRRFVVKLKEDESKIVELLEDGSEIELEKSISCSIALIVSSLYARESIGLERLKYDMGIKMFEFADEHNDMLVDVKTGEYVTCEKADELQKEKKKEFCEKLINGYVEFYTN